MRLMPLLMQLLTGMSMRRYLPPMGTAGSLRFFRQRVQAGTAAAPQDEAENVLHGKVRSVLTRPGPTAPGAP
jgi:hypothetical protein